MEFLDRNKIKNITPRCCTSFLIALPFWLRTLDPWLQWALATIVLVIGAWPILQKGFTKGINRFTLMALSLSIAYLYSFLELLLGDSSLLYFKPVVSITAFFLLWLQVEQAIVEVVLDPLKQFSDSIPKNASKLSVDGHAEVVSIDRIVKGDFVQVKPGAIIPVDGMIFSDSASVIESILSESVPVNKRFGESVLSGWKNEKTVCIVQAACGGDDSTLMRMQASILTSISRAGESNSGAAFGVVVIGFVLFCFLFWVAINSLTLAVGYACTVLVGISLSAFEFSKVLVTSRAIGIGIKYGFVLGTDQKFEKKYQVSLQGDNTSALKAFNNSLSSIRAQNVFLASLYNIIILFITTFGSISFVWAAIAMMGAPLCIIINSFRFDKKS